MRVVNLIVLACVLRATTKKRQLGEGEEKCTPEKILATPMTAIVDSVSGGRCVQAAAAGDVLSRAWTQLLDHAAVARPHTFTAQRDAFHIPLTIIPTTLIVF